MKSGGQSTTGGLGLAWAKKSQHYRGGKGLCWAFSTVIDLLPISEKKKGTTFVFEKEIQQNGIS